MDDQFEGQDLVAIDQNFVFPKWANYLLPAMILAGVGAATYLPVLVGLAAAPETTDVGYAPKQPIEFSHAVHAGQLGMDCRYCHNTVEDAGFAAIPPTQTCMNCHGQSELEGGVTGGPAILYDSQKLALLHEKHAQGLPVEWVKVHDLPDYAYFNHAAHVNKGVGCVTCHGQVDKMGGGEDGSMDRMYRFAPLSMAWCLDCHREPEKFLRPREEVTNMAWDPMNPGPDSKYGPMSQLELGKKLKHEYQIRGADYMQSCSTCHR